MIPYVKSKITIDANGWINPVCPKCECVMEFNYHMWIGSTPDLNLYCRYCHFAVSITPASTDRSVNRTPNSVTIYNSPDPEDMEEEE